MIVVKAKTPAGHIAETKCEEIIEIDGLPYQSAVDASDLRDAFLVLSGRVEAIEKILQGRMSDG